MSATQDAVSGAMLRVALALFDRGLNDDVIALTDEAALTPALAILRTLALIEVARIEEAAALQAQMKAQIERDPESVGHDPRVPQALEGLGIRLGRLTAAGSDAA